MWKKIKGIGWVIIGLVLMAVNYFWTTPLKTGSAVLQLEDSDLTYGLAQRAATSGGLSEVLFYVPLLMIGIGVVTYIKSNVKEKEIVKEN